MQQLADNMGSIYRVEVLGSALRNHSLTKTKCKVGVVNVGRADLERFDTMITYAQYSLHIVVECTSCRQGMRQRTRISVRNRYSSHSVQIASPGTESGTVLSGKVPFVLKS